MVPELVPTTQIATTLPATTTAETTTTETTIIETTTESSTTIKTRMIEETTQAPSTEKLTDKPTDLNQNRKSTTVADILRTRSSQKISIFPVTTKYKFISHTTASIRKTVSTGSATYSTSKKAVTGSTVDPPKPNNSTITPSAGEVKNRLESVLETFVLGKHKKVFNKRFIVNKIITYSLCLLFLFLNTCRSIYLYFNVIKY